MGVIRLTNPILNSLRVGNGVFLPDAGLGGIGHIERLFNAAGPGNTRLTDDAVPLPLRSAGAGGRPALAGWCSDGRDQEEKDAMPGVCAETEGVHGSAEMYRGRAGRVKVAQLSLATRRPSRMGDTLAVHAGSLMMSRVSSRTP